MTAIELLNDLWRRGVVVAPEAGTQALLVQPSDRLTDTDRAAIRALKPELLLLLGDPYERAKAIARHCEAIGADLKAYLAEYEPNLLNEYAVQSSPAESLLATCTRHSITLRIDADGILVVNCPKAVGLTPSDWQALKCSLEAHAEAVAALVKSGWTLRADFPQADAA